jgi:hypothetical protein
MTSKRSPEQLVRLSQAVDIVEEITGERPDLSTIYRWTSVGIRGARLRIGYAGSAKRTSEAWLLEFFEHIGQVAEDSDASLRSKTTAESSRAAAQLAKDGI